MRHPHRWTQIVSAHPGDPGHWLCLCGTRRFKIEKRWVYRTSLGQEIRSPRSIPPCPRHMSILVWWYYRLRRLV